ncbi:hypothetical protein OG440_38310 (plasmid) [Streptomyces sp. NBC_00637]|uniref:hypothetical protein n=1 Tax=Streptomyces sp. NBC_00637 TaxID=2903667 RepID=UPI002F90D6D9
MTHSKCEPEGGLDGAARLVGADAQEENSAAAGASRIADETGVSVFSRKNLQGYAFSAHVLVFKAADALEEFRLRDDEDRLTLAEKHAEKAMAHFAQLTGEDNSAVWTTAVLYMVQVRSQFHAIGRFTAFDPAPKQYLFTATSPFRLETIARSAHERMMAAARCLTRPVLSEAIDSRAEKAVHEAAQELNSVLPGLSLRLWELICRYCAELHAANLHRAATAAR